MKKDEEYGIEEYSVNLLAAGRYNCNMDVALERAKDAVIGGKMISNGKNRFRYKVIARKLKHL